MSFQNYHHFWPILQKAPHSHHLHSKPDRILLTEKFNPNSYFLQFSFLCPMDLNLAMNPTQSLPSEISLVILTLDAEEFWQLTVVTERKKGSHIEEEQEEDLDSFRILFVKRPDVESVGRVDLSSWWNQRWRVLEEINLLPVNANEERMLLQFQRSTDSTQQSSPSIVTPIHVLYLEHPTDNFHARAMQRKVR